MIKNLTAALFSFCRYIHSCHHQVTEILGAPDIYIEEGVTMNLTCMVR